MARLVDPVGDGSRPGVLRKEADAANGRAVRLYLTSEGEQLVEAIEAELDPVPEGMGLGI